MIYELKADGSTDIKLFRNGAESIHTENRAWHDLLDSENTIGCLK